MRAIGVLLFKKITPPLKENFHATTLIMKLFDDSLDVGDYFRYYYKYNIFVKPFLQLLHIFISTILGDVVAYHA